MKTSCLYATSALLLLAFSGSSQAASGCSCEHYGSQFDQICEVSPDTWLPLNRYVYNWNITGGYIPGGTDGTDPVVHVTQLCPSATGLTISVDIYKTRPWSGKPPKYLETVQCVGGTSCHAGGNL